MFGVSVSIASLLRRSTSGGIGVLEMWGPNAEARLSYRRRNPTRGVVAEIKRLNVRRELPLGVSFVLRGKLTWKALSRKKFKRVAIGKTSKTWLPQLATSSVAVIKTAIGTLGATLSLSY